MRATIAGQRGAHRGILGIRLVEVGHLFVDHVDEIALVGVDHHVGDLALFLMFEGAGDGGIEILGPGAEAEGGKRLGLDLDRLRGRRGGSRLVEGVPGFQAAFQGRTQRLAQIGEPLVFFVFDIIGERPSP